MSDAGAKSVDFRAGRFVRAGERGQESQRSIGALSTQNSC
jgi:hypothetical protein